MARSASEGDGLVGKCVVVVAWESEWRGMQGRVSGWVLVGVSSGGGCWWGSGTCRKKI